MQQLTPLILPKQTIPAAPGIAGLTLFARDLGSPFPALINDDSDIVDIQSSLMFGEMSGIFHTGNAATGGNAIGCVGPSNTGTLTARNVAATNAMTMLRRMGYVSAATAGSSAGIRIAALQHMRNGQIGFNFSCRFGVSDAATVANSRLFVGLYASTSVIGNVNPSTLLDMVGVGADAGETNLSIMHNDASGTATKVDLGANFPAQTVSADAYDARFFAPDGASGKIYYYVRRVGTANIATGALTTNVPTAGALMAMQAWRNNGTTALAVGLDVASIASCLVVRE
jgi:hypothetical protein